MPLNGSWRCCRIGLLRTLWSRQACCALLLLRLFALLLGVDQWSAAHWRGLPPDAFYEALAALWQRCLDLVPLQWHHVRIASVPKPDGSSWPLAIAAIAYRVAMTATMRALRPWVLSWAPAALVGGVPGRGPAHLHELLFADLHHAKHHLQGRFCGTKADVRRCFDCLDFEVSFRVFACLGAPPGLTAVLRFFYDRQLRWLSKGGAVHPQPVRATRGLLQGCPASPCLLNATMALWVCTVSHRAPAVRLAVYLDDRTLWQTGTTDLAPLQAAATASQEVDAATGMTLHPDGALPAGHYLPDWWAHGLCTC